MEGAVPSASDGVLGLSERRSCRIERNDVAVVERLKVLAAEHRRYGYSPAHPAPA